MNTESLRRGLLNYFKNAGSGQYTTTLMNIMKIKNASEKELIQLAKKAGVDLRHYEEKAE